MIQLYFLSVLCNGLCGYVLFAGNKSEVTDKVQISINSPTFHLVLGIMSAVTGILKLLAPPLENDIRILGDIIPSAAGIIAGFMLIFGIYRSDKSSPGTDSLDNLGGNLLRFRKPLGLVLLGVALIHFIFPRVLFL